MHFLIAPNAFKHSLPALEVASAIEKGLKRSNLKCSTELFPIGDGGDGTAQLLNFKLKGEIVSVKATDPFGRTINASFYLVENRQTAIIELAEASGIKLITNEARNPLKASTYGTGELILAALEYNVEKIIICIGGSATVDGGTGILRVLGVRFRDQNDEEIKNLPAELINITSIDISEMDKRINNTKIVVLCDVDNPLLGPQGAATIFGPQKGATDLQVVKLEQGLANFSSIIQKQFRLDLSNLKHGGAAGGTAAGLFALLNAKLVDGIDYFLEITGFENQLDKADIVITGEGAIDEQTLYGKGPAGVAKKAKAKGIPVIAVSGKVPVEPSQKFREYFDVLLSINNEPMEMQGALSSTKKNLERIGFELGIIFSLS
ncbi:MAG TPA: glycerate kinase [Flavisolibacter sp.]|jgi:glycerate kinase|nr:glycerate kinase [Flavisolibacter sp.]